MGHYMNLMQLAPKAAGLCEMINIGHSKPPILVSIKSPYAASY